MRCSGRRHVGVAVGAAVASASRSLLGTGLSLLMATMVVFFKDVEKALQYVQRILFSPPR
ncbi:MAG: hypothetical protein U5K30_01915 [Acidimicrobiales bacterium]|nr:hypothetical protein [Acidimicrobiales bacterium]